MVNNEIDGNEWVDFLGIALEQLHAIAHGGQVNNGRNTGEVLHQYAGGAETHLRISFALVVEPGDETQNVLLRHRASVFVAQQVFEQHLHGIGQRRYALEPVFLRLFQAVVGEGLGPNLEDFTGFEAVNRHGGRPRQKEWISRRL